jgi:hypothetical protein
VDWKLWAQPPGNSEQRIPWEIHGILTACDETSSWSAVMGTEYAFGNAEAGTYYPAAVPAIPILGLIAQYGEEWAKITAIEILTDWLFSFYPEPKYERIVDTDGNARELQSLVDDAIMRLRPIFEGMALCSNLSDTRRDLVHDILSGMDEMQKSDSATECAKSTI